ncbi:hypothetical protein [Amycolatopsis keratiniphila]|uniref:Uncharacterized protein n=1 Tax=Amycolatopsis keratiniphila subsp. keratiniphila TaxID=227715 RepID=A0A1W2LZC2_9PSEU|nr:hypothetical protein [Amycolatopsis keratiniphila]ONF72574.1 hypothetical protein AVR91_0210300 [Amycolatopsis keratiniphila subsp. keratiniphila]
MTFDIIGLCAEQPDPAAAIEAVLPLSGGLTVSTVKGRPLVRLCHPDGRLLLSIEETRLVRVPGEARRVLGIATGTEVPHPVWWVESRAPENDPEAEFVARAFTDALVGGTGGLSWSSR